jgi:hypothetical protein
MFIGACKRIGSVDTKYGEVQSFIKSYIQRKYKPYKYLSTNKSQTDYGNSWYIFFEKGDVLKGTYDEFVVRLSDHPVGRSRATSSRHVYVNYLDSKETIKTKIDDFLNPGKPKYKYEKDFKIVEGTSLQKALYPMDPSKTKHKLKQECIKKNKRGECVNTYEVEIFKPIFVGVDRPKWKG